LPTEDDLHAQQQTQQHCFGRLDAVVLGLSGKEEAGLRFVIDARSQEEIISPAFAERERGAFR